MLPRSQPDGCLPDVPEITVLALVFIYTIVLIRIGVPPAAGMLIVASAVAAAIRFIHIAIAVRSVTP